MKALRVALVGGLISFRGLFTWLHPAVFLPTMIVPPIFQVIFFAYLGRAAELESDTFYVVGNSIQLAALPGLFAVGQAINGERRHGMLAPLLASPASRVAIFLGRALPVLVLGFAVSLASFSVGALVLDVEARPSVVPSLLVVMLVAAVSCTALGIAAAALAFRARQTVVFTNAVFAVLLVFCGVNVPLDAMPGWMAVVAHGLPVTHAVEAGRELVAGAGLSAVAGLLGLEALIGAVYLVAGLTLLHAFERDARRRALVELA